MACLDVRVGMVDSPLCSWECVVEVASSPAHEEPHRQIDDDDRDRSLGALLHPLGQVAVEEQDRAGRTRTASAAWPRPQASPSSPARRVARSRPPATSVGDRGEVVGIGGVPQPEQYRDGHHDPDRAAVGEGGDSVVESEHQSTSGRALTVIPTPTARMSRALTAGRARTSGPFRDSRVNARRAKHGDETDRGDGRRQPEAEGDDQREAEADAVKRDGARGARRAPTGTAAGLQRRRCPRARACRGCAHGGRGGGDGCACDRPHARARDARGGRRRSPRPRRRAGPRRR